MGHTHEDVDQYFAQLARHLRSNEAETLPDLMRLQPDVVELKSIPDFRSWITPQIKPIKGHTAPLQFKFTHNPNSEGCSGVDVHYRGSCSHQWKPMESLLLAKPTAHIIKKKPQNVLPDFGSFNLDTLDARINRWSTQFDPYDDSSSDWWKCFAAEARLHNISERKRRVYGNRGVQWILPKLTKCNKAVLANPAVDAENLIGPHLTEMLTEEPREPQVR